MEHQQGPIIRFRCRAALDNENEQDLHDQLYAFRGCVNSTRWVGYGEMHPSLSAEQVLCIDVQFHNGSVALCLEIGNFKGFPARDFNVLEEYIESHPSEICRFRESVTVLASAQWGVIWEKPQ